MNLSTPPKHWNCRCAITEVRPPSMLTVDELWEAHSYEKRIKELGPIGATLEGHPDKQLLLDTLVSRIKLGMELDKHHGILFRALVEKWTLVDLVRELY